MIRAVAVTALCAALVGGCATADRILRRDDSPQVAESIQQLARIIEVAAEIAKRNGAIDEDRAAHVAAGVWRVRHLGTEANVALARIMLLQILGELPIEAIEAAEDDVGVEVPELMG